ncbi:MAG: NADPH:quinone oxidoreductase family protein [Sphingomonadales bacterium]|jgi:NADPH2:quinone reductase|uniref:NADPH:quinone oxidoreductase family protein n=3 Tax=Sphingorhabdus sp. TaxID=1902408 RepID=UPI003BAF7A82|nr:NADPH:quinone oxidoreductase family protein [Sphingomonadales bacterium]MBK9431260.1 NADPH:quinone oxidoreductase family protein [Sphingomonadales bacterium]
MKALLSTAVGGPDTLVLGELPEPVAGKGQVVVAIKACAINFPDTLMIEDKYQIKPPRPFAPGGEIAGIVEAVGEGVSGFAVGDRVMAGCGTGGLTEKIAVSSHNLYKMPDSMPFEDGASILMTYGTSIHALKDRGHMKPGANVLVLGGAGGIGISAIELVKAWGGRAVAGVSSEAKAEIARNAGADEVVVYARQPFDKDQSKALAEQFKAAAGPNGFDIIYDTVGGDYSEPAVRSIAWEGRFLVVGFPAGIAKLPLNLTLLKSCDVCGVFWGAFAAREPERNRANIAELFELYAAGKIKPVISGSYPLEKGGDAIAMLGNREAVGKLVVTI